LKRDEFEHDRTTAVGQPTSEAGPDGYALAIHLPGEPRLIPIESGSRLVIGRVLEADIVVADSQLSRLHARVERQADAVWIEDLDSTNGTWVNGERVARRQIHLGDQVRLGSLDLSLLNVSCAVTLAGPANTHDVEASSTGDPTSHGLSSSGAADAPLFEGEAMRSSLLLARRVASSTLPLLIQGETGTGKEVLARLVHRIGDRGDRPLHCINCGAIPRDLVQSVLFGHEKGSFTGATQQRRGVFEEASGGTLLLDEVGELPPEAQVALLRVLDTGRVMRVGSSVEISVDVRVISATHRDLESLCALGHFRRDLYYRLNAVNLTVPALRQRTDEILPLAAYFVERASRRSGGSVKSFSADARGALIRYGWPGNVRELRHAAERALIMSRGAQIDVSDLPDSVREADDAMASCAPHNPLNGQRATPALDHPAVCVDLRSGVRRYEAALLAQALEHCGWNRTLAAAQLQMPLRTLMYKLRDLDITPQRSGELRAMLRDETEAETHADFKERVRLHERGLLQRELERSRWNKTEAARRLGLPLSTLNYKLKTHGLSGPGH
jgi:two-component system response regulator AtoC